MVGLNKRGYSDEFSLFNKYFTSFKRSNLVTGKLNEQKGSPVEESTTNTFWWIMGGIGNLQQGFMQGGPLAGLGKAIYNN